jgi:hypothetical protein
VRHTILYWIACVSLTFLVGCAPTTMRFLANGKPVLQVAPGQVVTWLDPGDKLLPVTFNVSSPCNKKEGKMTDTCTTSKEKPGFYPYSCTGCSDPGLIIGKTNKHPIGGGSLPGNTLDSPLGTLYCDAGVSKVYPDPLRAAKPAQQGDTKVQWIPVGGSNIKEFTITPPTGTCYESAVDQKNDGVCTLLTTAASQTYTIKADACSTPGTAQLTIF